MDNKLHTFEKSLDKLNLVDVNKFSTTDFKSVNNDIETQLNNFKEMLELGNSANIFSDDQIQIKNIIDKIEKLEARILPKADLINSFSEKSL
jgi:hypothetical protein